MEGPTNVCWQASEIYRNIATFLWQLIFVSLLILRKCFTRRAVTICTATGVDFTTGDIFTVHSFCFDVCVYVCTGVSVLKNRFCCNLIFSFTFSLAVAVL